ncbi:MAG: FkbM family methyltransferase [Pseudomonadota bacterium]
MISIAKMSQRIREEPKPFKFLLSRILMVTHLCKFLRIHRGASSFRFSPSALAAEMWLDENPSADEIFFSQYLQPDDCVVDVGANIGQLTVLAAKLATNGAVYAIEPHTQTFRYLRENIKLNSISNVAVFNCALGSSDGTAKISNLRADTQNRITSLDASGIEVSLTRLDTIVDECLSIALLKVDVEGYEKFVFEGGEEAIQKTDCIYFELWDEHTENFGYHSSYIFDLLTTAGFSIFERVVGSNNRLTLIRRDAKFPECVNLFAIKDWNTFASRTNYIQV